MKEFLKDNYKLWIGVLIYVAIMLVSIFCVSCAALTGAALDQGEKFLGVASKKDTLIVIHKFDKIYIQIDTAKTK